MIEWYDIAPEDAVNINLLERLDITAPLDMEGERCPWPWEPQQLVGVPMGQYHCPYCEVVDAHDRLAAMMQTQAMTPP